MNNNINWEQLLTDNTTLVINLVSVLLFLVVGMLIRGRLLDEKDRVHSNLIDFVLYASVLCYGTVACTFQNFPIPFWGYAIAGVIGPPLTVPVYKAVVANGPRILGAFIPDAIKKLILLYTKPATLPPTNNEGDDSNG